MTNPNPDTSGIVPWVPGQSGNPKGRPKKIVSQVLDELHEAGYENITKIQVVEIYEVLLSLPEIELKGAVSSEDTPMIYRVIAKAILSKNGFEIVERMLDRTHGKPTNKTKVEVTELDAKTETAYSEFLNGATKYIPIDNSED